MPDPIVIIGGGLAGLTCAKQLHAAGEEFVVLEGSDGVGGRVRTDETDGFLLDRGFQVLLTAYPEAVRNLDYDALNFQAFEPGSLIRTDQTFRQMSDPWRRPSHVLQTAFCGIGSLADKLRIGYLRWSSGRGDLESVFRRPDCPTDEELQRCGFSPDMVQKFLRPFLGGVFLDRQLQTSCRMLYFVFRMFSQGDTVLPATGMGAIPLQLAQQLPPDSVRLNSPVSEIHSNAVTLDTGRKITCKHIIIATEQPTAAKWLPELAPTNSPRSVHCVYFSAPEPPVKDRMLVLNGTGRGVVNNMCVPSQIAANYAPDNRSLVSTTVLNTTSDRSASPEVVKTEMREWFGASVDAWHHLRTYSIPYALPNYTTPAFNPPTKASAVRNNVFVCGDYRTNGSINGAMQSGRLAAEEVLQL